MSNNNNQAGWQWLLDDEERCDAEGDDHPVVNRADMMGVMFYDIDTTENEESYHGA